MRFVWVDAGNNASWAQLQAHGITGEFYAASDPAAAVKQRLDDSKARRHAAGIYGAWNWIDGDGEEFAEWLDDRVGQIVPSPTAAFPKVQLNNERHDADDILRMLRRWRALRPKQDTSWTMEGGQGGWMSPAFVDEVMKLKVRVVPQLYNGAMTEAWDSLTFARDLTKRGFPDALISPFYDASRLPVGWDGFAFTQGRLSP